jgi:hypothetical protein
MLPFTIPPYNGKYDPVAYIDRKLEVEQKFSYHDIPAISQVQTAISAFTNLVYFGGIMNINKNIPPLGLN